MSPSTSACQHAKFNTLFKSRLITPITWKTTIMIMVLPFITLVISIGFSLRGQRVGAIGAWVVTFIIFLAWSKYHMTDPLHLSL